jgi:hypothetical protein
MESIEKCGLCTLLHGNTEIGHKPDYKFWFPTITKEVKNEIFDSLISSKSKELKSLIDHKS